MTSRVVVSRGAFAVVDVGGVIVPPPDSWHELFADDVLWDDRPGLHLATMTVTLDAPGRGRVVAVPKPLGHRVWTTRDGRLVLVAEMAEQHVVHTYAMLERRLATEKLRPSNQRAIGLWIKAFDAELSRRAATT